MKPAGSFLLIPAGLTLICGGAEPDKPKLSEHLRQAITARLPAYISHPAARPDEPEAPQPETDPDLLVLSKIMVKEKRPPGNDPDVWLNESVIQKKAMVAYKTSMTDLEWALNSWFIPLFTPPPSARARAYYGQAKVAAELDRLNGVIRAVGAVDPKEAARLKRELIRPSDSLPTSSP